MREWIFGNIIVKEVEFDYDLHNLEVYNGEKYLGKIYPHTTEVMEKMFEELDNGINPIDNRWKNGSGKTCTIEGWEKLDNWRCGHKENFDCAKAIDKACGISMSDFENPDIHLVDIDKVLDTVVAEYGVERVTHVLAAHVVHLSWTGPYHNDVKTWAKEQTKELSFEFMVHSEDYSLNAHPILIDRLATKVMQREKELERATPEVKADDYMEVSAEEQEVEEEMEM